MRICLAVVVVAATALSLPASEVERPNPSLNEVLKNLEASDAARRTSFPGYSSIRHYTVENGRFGVKATMKVRVEVDATGAKQFHILEVKGPGPIRKMVFERMLKTERLAATPEKQALTRISADNYTFSLDETAIVNGKRQYVLAAEPKTPNPLLLRGRVWVDAETFAIVRIEGAPARNPSFWVRKTHFVHEYTNVGGHWLAAVNRSESEIRIFGRSVVTIQYGDYELTAPVEIGDAR